MAATVPAELRTVFDRFYTTEYVTVDGQGQPIAWPVTPYPHEWQRNFQVRGELVEDGGGWALQPHKVVGGFEVPETQVAILRENFKKVMRYRKIAKEELAKRSPT